MCIRDSPWLTLYAFSSENWNRPQTEVRALMLLLHEFLKKRLNQMMEKGVRLHAIGDLSRIPARDVYKRQASPCVKRESICASARRRRVWHR